MAAYKYIFRIVDNEIPTCATCLKTFVNILSRLLLLPCKVQWIGNSEQVIGNSGQILNQIYGLEKVYIFWRWMQIIVYFGAATSTIYNVYDFMAFFHVRPKTLAFILSLVSDFCQFGVLTLVWKLFWLRRDSFKTLLNTLGHYENDQKPNWKFKTSMSTSLLVVLGIIISFASPHQRKANTGMATIITNAIVNFVGCLSGDYITVSEYWSKFIYYLIYFWSFWSEKAFTSSEYLLIVVAYTAYLVGGKFVIAIRSTKSIDELMFRLRKLKFLNEQMSSAFGNVYFLHFICTISYYAATPAYLTNLDSIPLYWYKLVYMSMHSLIWIGTSEFHRIVQVEMRRWISENKLAPGLSPVEIGKLNLLAGENENDPVGIYCRYFTVNYQLLGSLIGLLITYSIIAIQIQSA